MDIEQTKSLKEAVEQLQALPPNLRQEVFLFIDFMRMRNETKSDSSLQTKVKKRHAGTVKGKAIFSDDFDEPLDDFEDYMV